MTQSLEPLFEQATRLLRSGNVVAFPTETVYGLGADAFNPHAVAKIFEIKRRPFFDPLIVHVCCADDAWRLCEPNGIARQLARQFWPGPLTLVLPKSPSVPDIVTSGLPAVAIRVPDHPVALKLLTHVGQPLAAPSANRFGRISPTSAEHVRSDLGSDVPLVIDGGPCRNGVESTVLSLADGQPTILRPGATPREAIEEAIGPVRSSGESAATPQSPGQLKSHYAPQTPMRWASAADPPTQTERVGLIAMKPGPWRGYTVVETLSGSGDLLQAAAGLFAAMRRLDAQRLDRIECERAPMQGLGVAINDRLTRACHRS